MKLLDRILQRWRILQARRYLPVPVRLIDIGAFHGELFQALGSNLVEGFGIEPLLTTAVRGDRYAVHPGYFPDTRPPHSDWDAVTMLAVLEHVPADRQTEMVAACAALLRRGGRVIVTVPSVAVDRVLKVLIFFHLVSGMSLEEHHGFEPRMTEKLFSAPTFRLVKHQHFQLGLNHLYVFAKQ